MSDERDLLQRSTAVTTVSPSVKCVLLLILNVRFDITCLSRHGHALACEIQTHEKFFFKEFIFVCAFVRLCVYVCVCVCVCVCERACVRACACVRARACVRACVCACACVRVRTCMCMFVHMLF